ncbi:MAG: EamA family transporter, partial [Rhizobacter sp.]
MKPADLGELMLLAALWGASFLFMRMGAAEFGPVALIAVRVGGAALFLMPLLLMRGQLGVLREHWRPIFVVGLTNSALPFLCFAYAALSITAGVLWLAWNKADHQAAFKPGGSGWAIVACLAGAVLYGISASLTKKTLVGVAPMAVAAG